MVTYNHCNMKIFFLEIMEETEGKHVQQIIGR